MCLPVMLALLALMMGGIQSAFEAGEEMTMIETIKMVCQVLSSESVTVDDVVSVVGHNPQASGIRSTIVQPNSDSFSQIIIQTKSDVPSTVELMIAGDYSLRELQQAFGDYHPVPRVHPEDTVSVAFSVDSGGAFNCTIFADFNPLTEISDETHLESLLIRRDRRL